MVNKCAVPNCSIGYKTNGHKLSTFRFPTDKEMKKKWACAVPREGWKPSGHSVLCEKHFVESDFQENTNSTRKKSCAKEMVH